MGTDWELRPAFSGSEKDRGRTPGGVMDELGFELGSDESKLITVNIG